MRKLKILFGQLPAFAKNKYFLTILMFVLWMLVFDKNNILSQINLYVELNQLKAKKVFFKEKLEEVQSEERELFTNDKTIEKFAREKYRMKKDDEDIFIIVSEK